MSEKTCMEKNARIMSKEICLDGINIVSKTLIRMQANVWQLTKYYPTQTNEFMH